MAYKILNIIANEERPAVSGEYHSVTAPASGDEIGKMAWSDASDVNAASDAASAAAPGWAALGYEARSRCLIAWGAALAQQREEIAYADAVDSGTPIRTMRSGISKGLDYLNYFAGLWSEIKGETVPASPNNLHLTVREPCGVVGIIIPFNHPAFFALSKSVPALLAGNTVVLKPSDLTPVTAYLIAKAAADTLPRGVFNVVQGGIQAGQAIVAEPRLRRLHFTGGVRTGLAVQKNAADSGVVKRISLELGGKNPLIVLPDIDPDIAAEAAVVGMNYTRNQGQSCGSTSRLFVHDSIADQVIAGICDRVSKIQMGMPEDDETHMGSLVSSGHQKRVLEAIKTGQSEGATLVAGGERPLGELATGAFVKPTVFDHVSAHMELSRREIFGPVLSVLRWTDRDDMLSQVNNSDYGLTAAVYTNNLAEALRLVTKIEAGYIWVNNVETRWKATPFGGYKNSGIGSEHSLGEVLEYTMSKTINFPLKHTD